MRAAHQRIKAFHERQLQKSWDFTDADGTRLGQQVTPARARRPVRARRQGGLSVVGADERGAGEGRRRARADHGEPESAIRWCSPRRRSPASTACSASAARRRSRALAYGTQSMPRVDKIVGPGQRLRRRGEAPGVRRGRHRHGRRSLRDPGHRRRQRAGRLGGDGPVLAGRARRARRRRSCFRPTRGYLDAVAAAIGRLLPEMPRRDVIAASLEARGALILTRDLDEACAVANRIAPEHLELSVEDPDALLPKLTPRRRDLPRALELGGDRRLLRRAEPRAADRAARRASRRRSASTTSRSAPA